MLESKADQIEKEEAKQAELEESGWRPLQWRRNQMLLAYIFMVFLMQMFIQFSFSDMFQNDQYLWIAVIKVFGLVFELYVESVSDFS